MYASPKGMDAKGYPSFGDEPFAALRGLTGGAMNSALPRFLWVSLAAGLPLFVYSVGANGWIRLTETPPPLVEMLPRFVGPPVGKGEALLVYTDRGRPVRLLSYPAPSPPPPAVLAAEEHWLRRSGLSVSLTPVAPPSATYVCHDWVFAGGRFALVGDPVAMILEDNGYQEISVPQAGDIAVYHGNGARGNIMHTGIVRAAEREDRVFVESKWAWMGRYVHPAGVYCNPNAVCSFYRSSRPGHLLRGLDVSDLPGDGLPVSPPSSKPREAESL